MPRHLCKNLQHRTYGKLNTKESTHRWVVF